MPEAACGGVKNVLAICGQDAKVSKAAQQWDSLLLRFKTEDEVSLIIRGRCNWCRFHCEEVFLAAQS